MLCNVATNTSAADCLGVTCQHLVTMMMFVML